MTTTATTTTVSLHLSKFPLPSPFPTPSRETHFAFLPQAPSPNARRLRGVGLGRSNCSCRHRRYAGLLLVGREDTELQVEEEVPPSPQDLENIREIKRVLDLLKKNRDMLFNEVKLTITIEDPREVERRKVFGIEDSEAPTREELAETLELVNEGKIPSNRLALAMLADEMTNWPNLEVEATKTKKKSKPTKSLYARITDTGVDLQEAARRLKFDWDSTAETEDSDQDGDDTEVLTSTDAGAPNSVLAVSALVGISAVLIILYTTLQ